MSKNPPHLLMPGRTEASFLWPNEAAPFRCPTSPLQTAHAKPQSRYGTHKTTSEHRDPSFIPRLRKSFQTRRPGDPRVGGWPVSIICATPVNARLVVKDKSRRAVYLATYD